MRQLAAAAIALVPVVAIALAAWQWTRTDAPAGSAPIHALAVLPFENISGDPAQDYFADGVTESLTRELGRMERLRVTPQTTALRYRRTHKPVPELSRELNVDAFLYGSVLREGDRVRMGVTLISGSDRRLWNETFDRPAREILALQRDIIRTAATHIALSLTPSKGKGVEQSPRRSVPLTARRP